MLPIQAFLILWTGIFWPPARSVDPQILADKPIQVLVDHDAQGATVKVVAKVERDDADQQNRKGCRSCIWHCRPGGTAIGKTLFPTKAEEAKCITIMLDADEDDGSVKSRPKGGQEVQRSKVIKLHKGAADCGGDANRKCEIFTVRPDARSGSITLTSPDSDDIAFTSRAFRLKLPGGDDGDVDQHMTVAIEGIGEDKGMLYGARSRAASGWYMADDLPKKPTVITEGPWAGSIRLDGALAGVEVGGPWLGITYGPVPKPLACHLSLDQGIGQMVLNVVVDSPADQAAMAQYDVILKLNEQDVSANTGEFLDQVRGLKPGEECTLTILRGCEKSKVDVMVGQRPKQDGPPKYKYEADVEEQSLGRVFRHGGMLEKDSAGRWSFKDFDLEGLPDVFKWIPEDGEMTFEIGPLGALPHREAHTFLYKEDKGTALRISRDQNGKIEVTRTETGEGGGEKTTTVKEYTDEDELKKDDPEAYDLLQKCPEGALGVIKEKEGGVSVAPGGRGLRIAPPEELKIHIEEARQQAEAARQQAKELQTKVGRLKDQHVTEAQESYRAALQAGKAKLSFEISANGEIRVSRRLGEDELTEVFKNADELKAKRPELYSKFQKLRSRGGEPSAD